MRDLDIIVPVKNEANSIEELVKRINLAFKGRKINYRIIFVDDHSEDNTLEIINKYINREDNSKIIYDVTKRNKYNEIKLLIKKGKPGKAYSILEGAKFSDAKYLAFIDGDLQYPPEVLPQMYLLAKKHGICVAQRKEGRSNVVRKFGSRINKLVFEKILHDLNCDVQSGLKVFKKEIIEDININEVNAWTLDLPLLLAAKNRDYNIQTVDIDFIDRKSGKSKVNFVKTAFQIAKSSIYLKLKPEKMVPILPRTKNRNSFIGAGVIFKGKKFITHNNLPIEYTALETFTLDQKLYISLFVCLFLLGLLLNAKLAIITCIAILSFLYFTDFAFTLLVLLKSLRNPPEINISEKDLNSIDELSLPIYSILCPLYKEAKVLPQFIQSIENISWPKNKLDVLLLLEEDDKETINRARSINLPKYFRIIVVPHSKPKTKPKACNFGLSKAKGKYMVVYDAEDKPDPNQLKKAYLAFQRTNPEVACLQCKLNYYNTNQNLLTRMFTAEYSLWFDLILPGLQSIRTNIPLGGTSNHFKVRFLRYLGGWDPFNVTEDCDLGARIFTNGFKTEIINSTTYEEANSVLKSWLKQRSRWIKGYLQTYLVHMRHPFEFFQKHKIHALIFQLVIGARMIFILINPILWLVTISYFAFRSTLGPTIESFYPTPILYMALVPMIFGNFTYIYNYMIACAKRDEWELVKYIYLIPFYWLATTYAAFIAFYQLIKRPHYWEKTEHGLHLGKPGVLPEELNISSVFAKPSFAFNFQGKEFYSKLGKVLNFIKNLRKSFVTLVWKIDIDPINFSSPNFKNFNNNILNGKTSRKLRILIFNWRDTKHVWAGGAEIYIQEIAKRWVENGNQVTIFCGNDGKSKKNEVVDGVNIIRRGGFYMVYVWAFLFYILKFRNNFDIIVDCENGIPFFSPIFSSLPKVLLIHHVHQEVFRNHLIYPLSILARKLEADLMPLVYKNVPIVTVSESSKNDIVKRGWARPERIEIVNPGVDLSEFVKIEKTALPSFIYLGRLKPYKNIDLLLCSFSKILNKYPNAKLSIAGDGESLNSLKILAKNLNLSEAVTFYGRVDDETRAQLLSQSWASIQPSSYEGWGLTVIEANASGTCVVASDVNGLRDSVVDGQTGILFPVGDINELSLTLERIINNEPLRRRLSENAYYWSQRFDWAKSSFNFENILRNNISQEPLIAGLYNSIQENHRF